MPSSPIIGTVVLAGGKVPASLADRCAHRALLAIGGRPMLGYVLEALRNTPEVTASVVVAHPEVLAAFPGVPETLLPAGETIVDNMQRGAAVLAERGATHVLFLTGDLPLITPAALKAYIDVSLVSGASLTYPIIPREASEARFPGAKRTYVKLKDGTFTGGNAIFTVAGLLNDKAVLIQSLYNARKDPLKLAGILGWSTVFGLLGGTLTLARIEQVATRVLAAPAKAVITPHPELGFDVDKPADIAAVETAL
jgi:GTP:adenosylcobinamide-phosphate guanylyltransferase